MIFALFVTNFVVKVFAYTHAPHNPYFFTRTCTIKPRQPVSSDIERQLSYGSTGRDGSETRIRLRRKQPFAVRKS